MSATAHKTMCEISREESIQFVVDKLQIANASDLLSENRHVFLDKFMQAWLATIPFQSVNQKAFKNAVPAIKDALRSVVAGEGGLCGTQGVSACHILTSLGFDCHLALGAVQSEDLNHVVLIVNNLDDDGDMFLCPLGLGYPAFHVIQVKSKDGFITDSGPLISSVVQFRYIKDGDSYIRFHEVQDGKDIIGRTYPETKEIDGKTWGALYKFTIAPRNYEDICYELNQSIYRNPAAAFNNIAMAMKFPGGRLLFGSPRGGFIEDDCGKLKQIAFDEALDHKKFLISYFPEIPSEYVDKAFCD